jgi:hypothetical protein
VQALYERVVEAGKPKMCALGLPCESWCTSAMGSIRTNSPASRRSLRRRYFLKSKDQSLPLLPLLPQSLPAASATMASFSASVIRSASTKASDCWATQLVYSPWFFQSSPGGLQGHCCEIVSLNTRLDTTVVPIGPIAVAVPLPRSSSYSVSLITANNRPSGTAETPRPLSCTPVAPTRKATPLGSPD